MQLKLEDFDGSSWRLQAFGTRNEVTVYIAGDARII